MSPFCEICEEPFDPNRDTHVGDCIICGQACCIKCISKDRICKECDSTMGNVAPLPEKKQPVKEMFGVLDTLIEEQHETKPITEEALNPANWEITNFETDCGSACTPNGCCGHSTDVPETLTIGGYSIQFPTEDLTDTPDWNNMEAIGRKLREVFEFYAAHHKK